MAAGVPAVSYDCPSGPREIIEHDVNGLLVLPGSEEGLAAALLRRRHRRRPAQPARAGRGGDRARLGRRRSRRAVGAGLRRGAGGPAPRRTTPRRAAGLLRGPGERPGVARTRRGRPGRARPGHARTRATADRWPWRPAPPTTSPTSGSWCRESPGLRPWWRSRCRPAPTFLRGLAAASTPAYLSLRDPGDNGWPERRGRVADLAEALVRRHDPARRARAVADLEHRAHAAEPGVRRRGAVLGRGRRGRPARAARQPLRRPDAARRSHGHASGRGPGRATLPLMTLPTLAETTVPVDVVYTWVDGGDPELVRPPAGTPRDLGGEVRDGDVARVERPRPFREPRRAALLAAQPAPLRARGSAPSTSSPTHRCRRGSTCPTRRSRWSTTATSCRPRRCRRSTRTPSRAPCTGSPAWPSTSSTSTTTCCSGAPSAPSGSSTPRAGSRSSPPRTSSGSATRTASRPTSPRPCATAGSSRRPSASRSPTTWCTRPTRNGSRCSPRSPTGSRPRSGPPRTRRSAPRPTCRWCRRWRRTTG